MPVQKISSFDWALCFQWLMATTVGWVLGRFLLPNLAFITIGIGLGVLQWLILQYRIKHAQQWILATIFSWTLGSSVILFLMPDVNDFIAGLVIGVATGTGQWLVLRRELHWAGWWIPINVVAWTTGMALLPGVILTGIMAGLVTGIAIELLLRTPRNLVEVK